MKGYVLVFIIPLLALLACASPPPSSVPEPVPAEEAVTPLEPAPAETPPQETVREEPPPEVEKGFDPDSISEEVFVTTKADIQRLVQDLNKIIRAGNYNAWLSYLGDEYRERINSREFLEGIVERYPVFRGKIKNSRDYFRNVVIPSRANDQVDDIEFVSNNEVKAYSADAKGQTVVLYYLENLDGKWKIAN